MIEWNWGKPLIEGFSNKPQKGYNEIMPDAGTPYRRLKFADIGDLATCNFILNRSDYLKFMSWYKFDIRQGTLPFLIWDCRYGRKRVARLIDDVPQYNPNSKYYTLSLTMYFQPEVISQDFRLIVNDDDPLVVNALDYICASGTLRI